MPRRQPLRPGPPNPVPLRAWFVWVLFVLFGLLMLNTLLVQSRVPEVSATEFYNLVNNQELSEILINRDSGVVVGKYKTNGSLVRSAIVSPEDLDKIAREKGVLIAAEKPQVNWLFLFGYIILPVIFLIFIFRAIRSMRNGDGGLFGFGKSLVRWHKKSDKTFDDVAGIEEAKEEVRDIIDFLSNPEKYHRIGARIPRGILLVGPPGTGKTLLAKAVAGEADVPFGELSGSEFIQMFVGVGASRVRDLFAQAKAEAPCILFIDELDAVGQKRAAVSIGGGHDEREQTIAQLFKEMDGMGTDVNIIIIAATNRPDTLDSALIRPGRFDRIVVVDRPDRNGRKKILEIHARNVKLDVDADLEFIAKGTTNFSGADLANLINEAAVIAAKEGAEGEVMVTVKQKHLNRARDKVMMGLERKRRITPEEKKRVAIHEAGHAIMMRETLHADPVYKVSIIPRGSALGVTASVPAEDRYLATTEQLLAQIDVVMGGRVAENVCLGSISSGAENDIDRVTMIARKMVCEYGMSAKIGQINLTTTQKGMNFLSQEFEVVNCSEATKQLVDDEVRRIVNESYQRAENILLKKRTDVEKLAEALLEHETLDAQEIETLLAVPA